MLETLAWQFVSHLLLLILFCIALRNRPALPAKPVSVWIQLYLDGSPLGPPIEVPVPIVARGRHAVEMGNDSDNATNASSSRISIGNIRHAVKAECGSVLTGVSLSMLQVFDSSWTEVAPTMQLNESTTWQAAIHGGATEEHPMIVYALPQPRE
jgi:hypothetical protein